MTLACVGTVPLPYVPAAYVTAKLATVHCAYSSILAVVVNGSATGVDTAVSPQPTKLYPDFSRVPLVAKAIAVPAVV